MAQKDARIRFLERELAECEKEIETMKDYDQPTVPVVSDVSEARDERLEAGEERLRVMERKVRELEALVKGLMEEVLDVKSVTMKFSRDMEERRRKPVVAEERKAVATLQAESRVSAEPRPVRAEEPRTPARPAEKQPPAPAPDDPSLELIMQNDGTLKPEPRRPSEYIIASTRTGNLPVKGRGKSTRPSDRTLFVEQKKKRSVDDVIQAVEDDTVDLDR